MTPEEAQLLAAKLSGGALGENPLPSASQVDAFRQRVLGAAPQMALDAAGHLPGVGGFVTAGRVGDAALGLSAPEVQQRMHERITPGRLVGATQTAEGLGLGAGGPADLSAKAGAALAKDETVTSPGGMFLRPQYTPDVNVEAAPTLAQQAGKKPGSGGGVNTNVGFGLKAAVDAARNAGLRTMEQERELTGELGVDKAGRTLGVADLQEAEAMRQQRLAEEQARMDAAVAEKHQAFLARNIELADQLAQQKTDPGRLMRGADAHTKVNVAIGGILGGGLAALNGGPNTSLARLDQMIDKDIRSQELELDNKRASLSARQSLFGQMLQETGDRRLAAQQTRVMMLEAAKLKVQADADRLGIPEIRTNAELATNQIQQKIDATRTAMAKDAYELFQRQAAAAAAAQRAAEEKAWQRSMEVAKLGLERDKLTIEQMKAMGVTAEDIQKQTEALGKQLSEKDLAQGREAVENAKRRLTNAKPDEGLPGVGVGADLREKLAARPKGLNALNPVAWGLNAAAGLSDQEKVSRGDWEKIKLAYQSQITGSGASDGERAMLSAAFEGAKSPAEQRNAIAQADAFFSRREAAIKAGFDPRAVATFEQRLQGIRPSIPDSVQVKKK